MNEKEISEIRRRFRPEKSNISSVRGCYVNDNGEIVSQFNQSITLMPEDEAEKFLAILKRTLSGALKKNLNDIEFSTRQVLESEEHKLLMALKNSALKDEDAVQAFFQRVIQSVSLQSNYVIFLAQDSYDVPYRSSDGARQDDASTDVFSYMLCSICPVKITKPALSYYVNENEFHSRAGDWVVSPPELGFMFPAFDDRAANIYGALYYSRDISESYLGFVDAVFGTDAPMPAATQKETFQSILCSTLGEECSFPLVQAVHGQLQEMVEEHKANKEIEPLMITKSTVRQILKSNGVDDARVAAFDEQFDTEFGDEVSLSPKNIVDTKHLEIAIPEVTIQVSPAGSDLVETRVINGAKYIVIRVESGVEMNGIPVHVPQQQ